MTIREQNFHSQVREYTVGAAAPRRPSVTCHCSTPRHCSVPQPCPRVPAGCPALSRCPCLPLAPVPRGTRGPVSGGQKDACTFSEVPRELEDPSADPREGFHLLVPSAKDGDAVYARRTSVCSIGVRSEQVSVQQPQLR